MAPRLSSPLVRVSIAAFVGVALTALGCSLIVDFDESKIPGDDTGVEGDALADTGPPPGDSLPKPDSDAHVDSHVDGDAPPAETTADAPDGTDTTPPPDTGKADTTATDTTATDTTAADTTTGTDTTVDDTATGTDTTVDDTTAADTTVDDTAGADTTDAATE
jgi:hypothetical protein